MEKFHSAVSFFIFHTCIPLLLLNFSLPYKGISQNFRQAICGVRCKFHKFALNLVISLRVCQSNGELSGISRRPSWEWTLNIQHKNALPVQAAKCWKSIFSIFKSQLFVWNNAEFLEKTMHAMGHFGANTGSYSLPVCFGFLLNWNWKTLFRLVTLMSPNNDSLQECMCI